MFLFFLSIFITNNNLHRNLIQPQSLPVAVCQIALIGKMDALGTIAHDYKLRRLGADLRGKIKLEPFVFVNGWAVICHRILQQLIQSRCWKLGGKLFKNCSDGWKKPFDPIPGEG